MSLKYKTYKFFSLLIGKITRKYYFEDFIRVYPDGKAYNYFGIMKSPSDKDKNNFLNHCKFYFFAAQFVRGKEVADIGCGTGYGCEIIKKSGARKVLGSDISKSAIRFAKQHFNEYAEFSIQGITDLSGYTDNSFNICISNEVLEHIKEYAMEQNALDEIKRITRNNGLIVIGTPNNELLGDDGFSYDEINTLITNNFESFCIFENALIPFHEKKRLWEMRKSDGRTGVIISENINFTEISLSENMLDPEIKTGLRAGEFKFENYCIDTTLLHNTHSWIIIAVNKK